MTTPQTDRYSVVERPEQPFVGLTRTVTMSTISEVADELPRLLAWVGERGCRQVGPPFLRYLVIDMAGDMVIQAGVPLDEPAAVDGDLEADVLPAGSYVTTTHTGPYEGLYDATGGLLRWAGERRLAFDKTPSGRGEAWTSRVEWYETDPAAQPDPSTWVTRLAFKLAD